MGMAVRLVVVPILADGDTRSVVDRAADENFAERIVDDNGCTVAVGYHEADAEGLYKHYDPLTDSGTYIVTDGFAMEEREWKRDPQSIDGNAIMQTSTNFCATSRQSTFVTLQWHTTWPSPHLRVCCIRSATAAQS